MFRLISKVVHGNVGDGVDLFVAGTIDTAYADIAVRDGTGSCLVHRRWG